MRRRPGTYGGLALLALSLAVATLLWALRPLPSGSGYELGVEVTAVLLVVWAAWAAGPTAVGRRAALLAVAAGGLAAGVARGLALQGDAEVVRTYNSLFEAIGQGRNPYTCDCIVHLTPGGVRLGDFNYPPAEIWPYQAVSGLLRHWDIGVLAVTAVGLDAIAFALLLAVTPAGRRRRALAFLPLLVLWGLGTTIGMTMVVTAAVVAVLLAGGAAPRAWHRPALWGLFGVGVLTKFAVLPLFATWWWWTAARRTRTEGGRGWRASAADLLVPAGIGLALCLPFGPASVVRNTVLFNAALGERARLTTFYPNVVSGLTSWAGASWLYPVLACAVLAGAVLVAPRFGVLAAMLISATAFLLVSPTPEPQYLPMVVLLFLGALIERERGEDGEVAAPPERVAAPATS